VSNFDQTAVRLLAIIDIFREWEMTGPEKYETWAMAILTPEKNYMNAEPLKGKLVRAAQAL